MDKDLQNCVAYAINGIIVDYFNTGIIPTLEMIKTNWQYIRLRGKELVNDTTILNIIAKVDKYYN